MPTIKDVARQAGVSTGTVSMVINGSKAVKMETRYRVLEVIREMGYVPNQYARSLVTKKKNVIGVIRQNNFAPGNSRKSGYHFDEIPDTYLADMLDDIVREVSSLGYSLLLDTAAWSSPDDPQAVHLPPVAQSGRIDGLMWAGGFMTDKQKELLLQLNIPVVTIGARHAEFDYVDTDPEGGMYEMTKYVLSQGHRDLAVINGPTASQTTERKLSGILRALTEENLELPEDRTEQASFSGLGGYNAMQRLWNRGARPTAVLTALDVQAAGAMRFLQEKGLRIPDDISVTGFEDGLLAEHLQPGLTTVCSQKHKLGLHAARILAHRIDHPQAQQVKLIIPPEIVIRGSVKALQK